jgi:hypothetical protein
MFSPPTALYCGALSGTIFSQSSFSLFSQSILTLNCSLAQAQ